MCLRYFLLDRDESWICEKYGRDIYVFWDVVFFWETSTSQRHNVVLQHTHFHKHTHTHTPTHDGPTVADRSSGSRGVFCRVLQNILDQKRVRKSFFDRQGVTQHPKIISRVLKIFSFVYVCFCMQALCCRNLRLC